MTKVRLVFARTEFDWAGLTWEAAKTCVIELPFDNSEPIHHWELIGAEWIDDTGPEDAKGEAR